MQNSQKTKKINGMTLQISPSKCRSQQKTKLINGMMLQISPWKCRSHQKTKMINGIMLQISPWKCRSHQKTKLINGIMLQISPWKCKCHRKQKWSMESRYKSLVKNAKVNKNKNDQSNAKTGGQTPKPPMPLAARQWFQRAQNPDPNKLHNASKSCSRPKPSTKRGVKFTKSTHMINGVLLLVFQCPNAQTLATWLTACLKHGWITVSIKTQAKK